MKVLCVNWSGTYFKEGAVYTLDEFDCVYNPKTKYTTAEPWYMYIHPNGKFILATDLIIALN